MTTLQWMDLRGQPAGEWIMWIAIDGASRVAVSVMRPTAALYMTALGDGTVSISIGSTAFNVPGSRASFEVPGDLDATMTAELASQALTSSLVDPWIRSLHDYRVRRNPIEDLDWNLVNQALAKVLADAQITDPAEMSVISTLMANDGGTGLRQYLTRAGFSPDDIRFLINRINHQLANTDPATDSLLSAVLAQDGGARLAEFLGKTIGSPESAGALLDMLAEDAANTSPARDNIISALMARDGGDRLRSYLEGAVGGLEKLAGIVERIGSSVDESNPAYENALSVLMAPDGGDRLKSYLARNAMASFSDAVRPERVAIVAALIVVGLAIAGLAGSMVWIERRRR